MEGYSALVDRIKTLVRFTVAFSDPIAVVADGDQTLLDLEGRRTFEFPPAKRDASAPRQLRNSAQAVAQLESLRNAGARFLLVPATASWWFDAYPGFRDHLESNYRALARTDDCVLFSLRWPEDGAFRNAGAPDGLPLPPPELIRLTVSNEDAERFCLNGDKGARWIEELLDHHGFALESVGSLLDFGCGCGRVLRRWKRLEDVRVMGADYNPHLVAWCRLNLPFARLQIVRPDMSVGFADGSAGLIYTMSVFTHLDEGRQAACLAELIRLLRPGGLLAITVSGSTRLDRLSAEERRRFDDGKLVVRNAELAGSNACSTYHPEGYVREVLAAELELLDIVPGGATDISQDVVLLRKPG